jgi:hypothetical protein
VAFANQQNCVTIFNTENCRFNKFEETKDFVFYSRDFVIAGAFYYKINDRRTLNLVLYCRNFVTEGVVILRFSCTGPQFPVGIGEPLNSGPGSIH